MVNMPVSVDNKVDVTTTKLSYGSLDPRNHPWKLIVYNEDTLITNGHSDVSTCSKQYVESRSDSLGFDLNRIEIDAQNFKGLNSGYCLLSLCGCANQKKRKNTDRH